MKKADKIKLITSHWEDDDFHKVRECLLNYVVLNNYIEEGDRYLENLCDLLGIGLCSDEDGYNVWYELDSKEYIKYIKL